MGRLIFTCPASPARWYISPKFLPTFISAGFPLNMKASVSEWDFSTERAQIWMKSDASHACSSINLTWQFDLRERETCGLQNFKCKWIASEFGSCLFNYIPCPFLVTPLYVLLVTMVKYLSVYLFIISYNQLWRWSNFWLLPIFDHNWLWRWSLPPLSGIPGLCNVTRRRFMN